jgi:hypothetical protein
MLRLPSPAVAKIQTVIATVPRHDAHFFALKPAVFPECGRTPPQHPQGADVLVMLATYVLRFTPRAAVGGSVMDGNILRRTTTISAPQQVHSIGGRGVVGMGGQPGCLNTNSLSSVIKRLLLGCRKPKLRERRNPLGNTCCNTSHKKVAPLTVRTVIFLVALSRYRNLTWPFSQPMMSRS